MLMLRTQPMLTRSGLGAGGAAATAGALVLLATAGAPVLLAAAALGAAAVGCAAVVGLAGLDAAGAQAASSAVRRTPRAAVRPNPCHNMRIPLRGGSPRAPCRR